MYARTIDLVIATFTILAGAVVATAECLSAAGRLDSPVWWFVVGAPIASAALAVLGRSEAHDIGPKNPDALTPFQVGLFRLTALTAVMAVVCNFVLAVGTAPGAWDALTYHLPKTALALQHGAFYTGPVNFWAQAAHPHYGTALLVMAGVATGAREAAWCGWQLISYGIAAMASLRIAQYAGAGTREAIFAGLLFLLLPSAIVQAPTPLNDMLLAAFTGAAATELLGFLRSGDGRRLVRFTVAIALGFGTKANFSCQILMLVALAGALGLAEGGRTIRRALIIGLASVIGVLLALPSGYIANVQRFGNFLGPPQALELATSGSPREMLVDGVINTTRLATDFVSLDGLPRTSIVLAAQHRIRRWVGMGLSLVPAVVSNRGARGPFVVDRLALAGETHAFWGVEGLLLIWPAVIIALWHRDAVARALALAALAYLLAQGFASAYDTWHGRYFLSSAVLAVPLAARFIAARQRAASAVLTVAVAAMCVSGIATSLIRSGAPLFQFSYAGTRRASILGQDRAAQLTRYRPELTEAVRRYDAQVPDTAIVGSLLAPDSFEYALFGPRLHRRIIPVGDRDPEWARSQGAAFLVFSDRRLTPSGRDVHLGADWWLRTLTVSTHTAAPRQ